MSSATTAGLYLHVPFCLKKCGYCSFFSVARDKTVAAWAEAVERQVAQLVHSSLLRGVGFNTIFFGGGTPTVLPVPMLSRLLRTCSRSFDLVAGDIEVSIEANPATVSDQGLRELRLAGFNRISIGVQSFEDDELQRLGRTHSGDAALQTIEAARHAGFDNLSIDLMYGLPGQNAVSWQTSLDKALDLAPAHLSLYELTPEPGTALSDRLLDGRLILPGEDTVLEMMEATRSRIAASALQRYELSNYARPGCQCIHNLNYWGNGDYLGLGPGAVSCLWGKRIQTLADIRAFSERIQCGQTVWFEEEHLDSLARFRETVVMGLRLIAGVSLEDLRQRFEVDTVTYYGDVLVRLLDQGLLVMQGGNLRLTEAGLPLANRVMAELV